MRGLGASFVSIFGWRLLLKAQPLPLGLTCSPHPRDAGPRPRAENCSLPAGFSLQRRRNRSTGAMKVPWGRRSGAHDGARVASHRQFLSPGHRPRLLGLHLPESWWQRQEDELQGLRYLLKEQRQSGFPESGAPGGLPESRCASARRPGPGPPCPRDAAQGEAAASVTPTLTPLPVTAVAAPQPAPELEPASQKPSLQGATDVEELSGSKNRGGGCRAGDGLPRPRRPEHTRLPETAGRPHRRVLAPAAGGLARAQPTRSPLAQGSL